MPGVVWLLILENHLMLTHHRGRQIKECNLGCGRCQAGHATVWIDRERLLAAFRDAKELTGAKHAIRDRSGRTQLALKCLNIPGRFSRQGNRWSFGHRLRVTISNKRDAEQEAKRPLSLFLVLYW